MGESIFWFYFVYEDIFEDGLFGIIKVIFDRKSMKKKYLIKNPGSQGHLRVEYGSVLNHSHQVGTNPRPTHNHSSSRPHPCRLKTEGPLESQFSKLMVRQQSTGNLRKGRFLVNKENSKLVKKESANRLTYNEYRASEFLQVADRNKLDTTIANNRLSESKMNNKRSLQKVNARDRFKFLSPQKRLKEFTDKLEIRSPKQLREEVPDPQDRQLGVQDIILQELIGSGTFGRVFAGRVKGSGRRVAVKKVQQDRKYKTRQLQIVQMLESPFIIRTLGTFVTEEGRHQYLNIVMEAYEANFFQLLKRPGEMLALELKCYVYQMLRGLLYLHSRGVCHRDLKPQNMLVRGKKLVICDFGSAKVLQPGEQNISYICSRCYRAPELIFQATNYTTQIDMWSLGCILLEVLNGRPLFIADSSLNHILEVIKVLGTPSREDVRAMNPEYAVTDCDLPRIKPRSFRMLFPSADPQFIDLAEKIVRYAPERRLTAAEALAHSYFDQLREEKVYRSLGSFRGLQNFFDFERDVLAVGLREKLVPKWWGKTK